jgi:O-antigen ligase
VRAGDRNTPAFALPDPLEAALLGAVLVLSVATGAAVAGRMPLMPLAGLLAIAGACILFSLRPEHLFLAWFVVAPLVQESASSSGRLGHLLNLALYQGVALVFVAWTLTRRGAWTRPQFVDALPLLFLFEVYVSLIVVGPVETPTVRGVYTSVGIGVVMYYFFAFGPIGALSFEHVFAVLMAVTILEGGMGIVDGLTRWNLWHDTTWQGASSGESRAIATLHNPSVLGTLLGMGVVAAVSTLARNQPARHRKLAIIALVFGIPGAFFTVTRGPVIGMAVGVVVVLLSQTKTRLLAAACAILAIVVITAEWNHITSSTVYRNRITNSGTVDIRRDLEHWSWKLAEKRPVFGWGYNSFDRAKELAGFTAQDLAENGTSSTSHNTYLTVLVEYGFFGLSLFILPWLIISWRAVKVAAKQPEVRWYTVAALSVFVVFVIASSASDYRFASFVPAIPWALLGLLRRRQVAEA